MAKPWPERPVSGANKSGKPEVTQRNVPPMRSRSETGQQAASGSIVKRRGTAA